MPSLPEFINMLSGSFLADVSVKAALLFGAAAVGSGCLVVRRSSAAARHLVWSLAVVSVLGLPLLRLSVPSCSFAIVMNDVDGLEAGEGSAPIEVVSTNRELEWASAATFSAANVPSQIETTQPVSNPAISLPEIATSSMGSGASATTWNLSILIWLAGVAASLLPMALGLLSLRRVARLSELITQGQLFAALQVAKQLIGITRNVRLLKSSARAMPMTWGFWRPTILLPDEAEQWSEGRLQSVLLHELAHIQRFDCVTQLFAQTARALYWFNPLAWLAERRLRIERERACDDRVLGLGITATDYAEHLLAVSTGNRLLFGNSAVALAMARTSKIERRLTAILNSTQNRRPVSQLARLSVLAAAILLFPFAAAQWEIVHATEPTTATTEQAAQAVPERSDASESRANRLAELRAKITNQSVVPVNEDEILQGAIKGMVGALRDPYADFLTAEMLAQLEKQMGGTVVGIGVQLELHEKQIRVVTALEDSPAFEAGIQPGDVITQIDEQHTTGFPLIDAVKRIAGQQGSIVRLEILRAGQKLPLEVTRNRVAIPTVKGFYRGYDQRWLWMLDPPLRFAYVNITQFGPSTVEELRQALLPLKAQGLRGVIVDLRFCPGGMLDAAVESAKLFLSRGVIVSLHNRAGVETTFRADADAPLDGVPVVLLVNSQTASAAEVFAGALQDNQRAIVLGTRTFGKGSVQSLIKLEEGTGAIKLTTSYYRVPSGRNIDKGLGEKTWGINPDEGYFVMASEATIKKMLERRQERDLLWPKNDPRPKVMSASQETIRGQQSDPQLAAALKTLGVHLATGGFLKVGNATDAEIEQFLKREETATRRSTIQRNIVQLQEELSKLENDNP